MSPDELREEAAAQSAAGPTSEPGKTCRSCLRTLPLSAFYHEARSGRAAYKADCKVCARHHAAEQRRLRKRQQRGTETAKWCPHCAQFHPRGDFQPDARSRDGLRRVCQPCRETAAAEAQRADSAATLAAEAAELLRPDHAARQERVSLGIAIAHATCAPGQRRSLEELAAYAGVTPRAIQLMEAQALRKVRALGGPVLEALRTLRKGEPL